MSIRLDDLKLLLADAEKQLAEAQKKFAYAQQVQQYAQYQVNTWTAAVNIETQAEDARQKAAAISAKTADTPLLESGKQAPTPAPQTPTESQEAKEINKTDIVRDVLRQHPAGLTPSDLWKQVKGQFTNRAYLYSVLKRLKDRDEVTTRRGKYLLKSVPKVEEHKQQSEVVQ